MIVAMKTIQAADGQEALEQFQITQIDLSLWDI